MTNPSLFEQKQRRLFQLYDADNNGFISQADFTNLADHMANNLGISGSPRHEALRASLAALWADHAAMDKDQSGKIPLEEWLAGREAYSRNFKRAYQGVRTIVGAIFDAFDTDGTKGLSPDEYKAFLTSHGISTRGADDTFKILDQNHNGVLSRDEFLDLAVQFNFSDEPSAVGNQLFGPLD